MESVESAVSVDSVGGDNGGGSVEMTRGGEAGVESDQRPPAV
jgi:hypothetical protein